MVLYVKLEEFRASHTNSRLIKNANYIINDYEDLISNKSFLH
jgi:hypothetical protein